MKSFIAVFLAMLSGVAARSITVGAVVNLLLEPHRFFPCVRFTTDAPSLFGTQSRVGFVPAFSFSRRPAVCKRSLTSIHTCLSSVLVLHLRRSTSFACHRVRNENELPLPPTQAEMIHSWAAGSFTKEVITVDEGWVSNCLLCSRSIHVA
jgi:hypothetical protein